MDKVSRPMQIALAATALFAVLWFVALKPKNDAAEPIAAAPVTTPAATARPVDAGGPQAQTGLGRAVESANNVAQTSNNQTHAEEQQTGEQTAPSATSAPAPNAANSSAATNSANSAPAATTPAGSASTPSTSTHATKATVTRSAAQRGADRVTEQVTKDLAARRAVIVFVWSPKGTEDKIVHARLAKDIDRKHGRVKVYYVPVAKVGLYEGLLGSLNVAQTPSTIVIAPDHEAQVLGGLVSTARIDRLTSAALLIKPSATPKP